MESSENGPRRSDHPSPSERAAYGRSMRQRVPRSVLAAGPLETDRADPVALLEQQAATRVPELVPVRHGRMLTSPFAFYRGGALLMASDLATMPRTDLTVQLCGDAHLSNFGLYAAPDRSIVFSINDFDETLPGPFEWDVKRLVASFAIAGRSRQFDALQRSEIAAVAARSYRKAMDEFARMRNLDLWYVRLDVDGIVRQFGADASSRHRKSFERVVSKARSKDSLRATERLAHVVDGELRFISDPPIIVPIEELVPEREADEVATEINRMLNSYRSTLPHDRRQLLARYRYAHLARKVVGVGSVGTRAWVLLLVGRDNSDPLLLQFKEAQASVLEAFLGASEQDNHGERVVAGQRLMQGASDIMLGWHRTSGIDGVERDFFARQLWDAKGSAVVEKMDPSGMKVFARMCGWALARAHARSGDAIAISGYLGSGPGFDRAMAEFSESYADQNDRDFATVEQAVAAGRLEAVTEQTEG